MTRHRPTVPPPRTDPPPAPPAGRAPRWRSFGDRATALLLTAAVGAGGWMLYDGTRTSHPPQPSAVDAFSAPAGGTARPPVDVSGNTPAHHKPTPLPYSVPVRLRIPTISLNAPLVELGLDPSGQLQVPNNHNRNLAGWYSGGVAPGAAGNAIIDGHVDTKQGPAVFFLLGALHKGDTIEVDRKDGRAALFAVDAIEVYAKDAFPSARVYGPTADPELRLITCGGGYTVRTGYLGNVVLYAHLIGSKPV